MSCETCAQRLQHIEALTAELENTHNEVRILERARTGDARKISALQTQLAQKAKEERAKTEWRPAIEELFDYWRHLCGHPNAKLTDDRFDAVRWCLEFGYTPDRIRRAIRGAARDPYVNEKGKRFDDLELICRKRTKNLEDFEARADVAPKPRPADGADTSTPLERMLLALRYEFGVDRVAGMDFTPGEWWSVCPLQPDAGMPLRLVESEPGGSVELACAHAHDPVELLEELRSIERKRLAGDIERQYERAA